MIEPVPEQKRLSKGNGVNRKALVSNSEKRTGEPRLIQEAIQQPVNFPIQNGELFIYQNILETSHGRNQNSIQLVENHFLILSYLSCKCTKRKPCLSKCYAFCTLKICYTTNIRLKVIRYDKKKQVRDTVLVIILSVKLLKPSNTEFTLSFTKSKCLVLVCKN